MDYHLETAAYREPGDSVSVALVTLAFFGYRATREWQRSSTRLVERRVEESAGLLVTALTRDMRGTQALVLASRDWRPFQPPR